MAKAMPGGPADKAGNLIEHLWTVLRITEMLRGKVRQIRLEPLGEAGTGVEFELVDYGGISWVEQVKGGSRTWTPRELHAAGVLSAAQLQVERGCRFCLVTVGPTATALETLADRARQSESVLEFVESLAQSDVSELNLIRGAWNCEIDEARQLLREIYVEHHTVNDLRRIVDAYLRLLYADHPEVVRGVLRSLCDENVHRTLTAQIVLDRLESRGFTPQLITGDHSVRDALRNSLATHQRRVEHSMPDFGLVLRDDARTVVEKLCDNVSGQVVVIDGRAGSGKSTIASEAATLLENQGWHVAAARMDTENKVTTSAGLGRVIELDGSPTVLLEAVAGGDPALLVIDQLDAVSMLSGRMADGFDAVAEIVAEAKRAPNIKLLLVTRTVDLEADPRLRGLLRAQPSFGRHTVGNLDIDQVRASLEQAGVPIPSSETTLRLLCTPLHLSVFSRLSESARSRDYSTLQQLYEKYTEEVRLSVENRVGGLDWAAITVPMIEHMNDNEVLAVPAAILDAAELRQVQALVSEAVLVRDESRFAFFHESYFDFLFARSFITAGKDLVGFLLEHGQALFRRAQTRQVLDHLLATDQGTFYRTAVELLGSDQIRSHIKHMVVDLLRHVPLEAMDWAPLSEVAWDGSWVSRKLVSLLRQPGWFDAADSLGMWERWLSDPDRVEQVFNQFQIAARERPRRAEELLRPHIGESDAWNARMASLISISLGSELVDFAIELIELGYMDELTLPLSGIRNLWWNVYSIKSEDAAGAAQIIGAILQRGLDRARAEGSDDPFESEHLPKESQVASAIGEIAQHAPAVFIDSVLPFVRSVAMAGQQPHDEFLPRGSRWGHRIVSSNHTIDDFVFDGTDTALQRLAAEDPAALTAAIEPLRTAESDELRFLACRALTAADDSDDAIEWLVSDPRNLRLGWIDSICWASRELVEKHSPRCSDELVSRLEDAVLQHEPDIEQRHPEWMGLGKYEILSALDTSRLSERGRRTLRDLKQRFADSPPRPPQPVKVSAVGSPISEDDAAGLQDDDWLQELREHDNPMPRWDPTSDRQIGGAPQLARQLGQHAENEPRRFAQLALRFDAQIPADAMDSVLRNVAKGIDADLLADVCQHARDVYGEECGLQICIAIGDSATANERLVRLLQECAGDTDPDHESARTAAPGGQLYWRGDLLTAGINSTRGQAACAIARVLSSGSTHVDDLIATIEALATDQIMAVRTCAADAISALARHDERAALDIAHELLGDQIELLGSSTVQNLLRVAAVREPDRFAYFLAAALEHGGEISDQAGRIWAIARWHRRLPDGFVDDFAVLPPDARRGAATVFANSAADCMYELIDAFGDPDAAVRSAASRFVWEIGSLDAADAERLIGGLLDSPAIEQATDGLIHTLAELDGALPPSSLTVCERTVEINGAELGDIRTSAAVIGRDLVSLVLRLYRQSDAPERARCLDIIDRLVEIDTYDAMQALDEER
ncbi:MAG: hypothetical protein F4091_07405 [Acidimicrobiales bacterium]|nr:hypothetical protein [Acidimicrobiales bacterium]MYD84135.1 hypothetical protein [Acidimicrobiales bacterium]MYJ65274.1 hypothetical protein [Acidimicrobiales bacterium]